MIDKHNEDRVTGQPLDWMKAELQMLDETHRLRQLRSSERLPDGRIRIDGLDLLNLCSNDYLGIIGELKAPALDCGAGGSRLICGNHPELIELERRLAELHGASSSLVFGSGFLANLGCLTALVDRGDVIFSDKLNHASIIDGALLSRAEHVRYRHLDVDHLETLLKKHSGARRKLIVTDSIFSMDGDVAPLERLVELKLRYDAMLMVDEAHSGGVMGPRGAGLSAALGIGEHVDVHMGTLSKAYGGYGAYICGSDTLVQYLINRARSLIFSTGLPPSVAASASQAVDWIAHADQRRQALQVNANYFRSELQRLGLDTGESSTQIVPMMLGSENLALRVSESLRDRGIAALPIRPPTVPMNSSRIRFSLMATHRTKDLDVALQAVSDAMQE
ncbi:8-amino-7-oxononanoate synthase [bacterium M21]|nr:8-amino-7-oxononanoate synthase [bacterium M21]